MCFLVGFVWNCHHIKHGYCKTGKVFVDHVFACDMYGTQAIQRTGLSYKSHNTIKKQHNWDFLSWPVHVCAGWHSYKGDFKVSLYVVIAVNLTGLFTKTVKYTIHNQTDSDS